MCQLFYKTLSFKTVYNKLRAVLNSFESEGTLHMS